MLDRNSTLTDVAFEVCSALSAGGGVAVMTGGSAATFYAPDACQSNDVDFVLTMSGRPLGDVLASIGYGTKDGRCFVSTATHIPIEFPKGPLAVGDDLITTWSTVRRAGQVLHVLTPTDCCRDRLAQFLCWNDFSALEQAIAVYRSRADEIDLDAVRDWCAREGQPGKYQMFALRLSTRGS